MNSLAVVAHLIALLLLPFFLVGVVNRTKARWAGRRGPKLLQSLFDAVRLLRKASVYSLVTTPVFRIGPIIVLVTTVFAGLVAPIVSNEAPVSFPYDFVVVAYVLGLGRLFMILAALDTASPFEGMGASREATFAVFAEPALFVAFGALLLAGDQSSLAGLLSLTTAAPEIMAVRVLIAIALFVLLQVEAARMPVDDPTTHLELTMIHEVMVLDHSGPELAFIQYAAGAKIVVYGAMVVGLLAPTIVGLPQAAGGALRIALLTGVAIAVGLVESLMARFKLRTVPAYIVAALFVSGLGLAVSVAVVGGIK